MLLSCNREQSTYEWYKRHLDSFVTFAGLTLRRCKDSLFFICTRFLLPRARAMH